MMEQITGRVTLHSGDCRDVLRTLPDNSIDSVVTDPPYALVSIVKRFGSPNAAPAKGNDAYMRASAGFMGKTWDTGETAFSVDFWAQVLRVLKPGGHVAAFGASRGYHRMACAIEDAGFEIRDSLMWVYGCLDDQTMAVTSNGVMPYHKIKKGDLVLSYDPAYMSYEWQPVEEVLVYDVDDTAYRISTDLGDQIVSRNHRCIVERGGEEVFEFAEEAARQREIRVPVLEDLRALLDAVPDPHEGASSAKQDVFEGLRECCDRREGCRVGKADGDAQREVGGELRGLRDGVLAQHETSEARQEAGVQLRVQRSSSRGGVEGARTYRAGELDTGVGGGSCGEDDGRDESDVEGRGYVQESEGELRVGSIRALSGRFSPDVAQGRVCDGASPECGNGDWSSSDASGVRTPYRPRSAEQRSDESDAVRDEQGPQVVRAWRGHKTVVGRITPERYRGVIWCVRVKSGAFVAVRNGFAFPTGNSGFPKSHDVSKGIDRIGGLPWAGFAGLLDDLIKASGHTYASLDRALGIKSSSCYWVRTDARGGLPPRHHYERIKSLLNPPTEFTDLYDKAEREVIAIEKRKNSPSGIVSAGRESVDVERKITAPATDAAREWQGWGTALKPAFEPIVLARKPLSESTVAANVLRWRTGALNIDGCRIAGETPVFSYSGGKSAGVFGDGLQGSARTGDVSTAGRWPANVCHDGSDEVVAAFPASKAGGLTGIDRAPIGYSGGSRGRGIVTKAFDDCGSAARFFYSAKASKADRAGSKHPTVKPVSLMQWLCRLITPPGGTVLDPFAGSGTTGAAARLEGFNAILIEREAEYQRDIRNRFVASRDLLEATE